jgi:hypothetical protein
LLRRDLARLLGALRPERPAIPGLCRIRRALRQRRLGACRRDRRGRRRIADLPRRLAALISRRHLQLEWRALHHAGPRPRLTCDRHETDLRTRRESECREIEPHPADPRRLSTCAERRLRRCPALPCRIDHLPTDRDRPEPMIILRHQLQRDSCGWVDLRRPLWAHDADARREIGDHLDRQWRGEILDRRRPPDRLPRIGSAPRRREAPTESQTIRRERHARRACDRAGRLGVTDRDERHRRQRLGGTPLDRQHGAFGDL